MVCLENSSQTLQKALDLLNNREEKKEEEFEFLLWKGYIYRNLGRVYSEMGKKELAKSILTEAENARVASLNYLNAKNLSNPIPLQLQLEVAVVQLDIKKTA
jgi:hypothetical protein